MKSVQLLKLLRDLEVQEAETVYQAVTKERERIARELKEQGYLLEDISTITKLDLTEVERLVPNRIRELIHHELQRVDKERRRSIADRSS